MIKVSDVFAAKAPSALDGIYFVATRHTEVVCLLEKCDQKIE
ncbi:hypothetical protein [Aminipila terrae]|nr:hypothetical protein [Aminipila terrae]